MNSDEAYNIVRRCFETGRMPHAYIIKGAPRGEGESFAKRVSWLLLCRTPENGGACGKCQDCLNVEAGRHMDVLRIEPESKSRQISVSVINDIVIPWSIRGSFLGGWKICIILFADRLNDNASNALLKTLEEPAERTLFLLVSDTPEMLLPTIISRCQKLDLSTGHRLPPEPIRSETARILARHGTSSELSIFATAGRFEELFGGIEKQAEKQAADEAAAEKYAASDDSRLKARTASLSKELRQAVYEAMKDWYRDIMICASAGRGQPLFFEEFRREIEKKAETVSAEKAAECLDLVDGLIRHMELRNIKSSIALPYWMGRLR